MRYCRVKFVSHYNFLPWISSSIFYTHYLETKKSKRPLLPGWDLNTIKIGTLVVCGLRRLHLKILPKLAKADVQIYYTYGCQNLFASSQFLMCCHSFKKFPASLLGSKLSELTLPPVQSTHDHLCLLYNVFSSMYAT